MNAQDKQNRTEKPDKETLRQRIIEILKTVYDPEIPVDIWELGMIYDISIDDDYVAHIKMTLTTPNCPVAGTLPGEVERRVRDVEGLKDVKVKLVWDPPWTPEMMSEAARIQLGYF
jgi:FeS assembly SUF system protein